MPTRQTPSARRALRGGLYVPAITTFDAAEAVDLDAFRAVLDYLIRGGVDGVVVAGSTGEAHALSPAEKASLFRAAVREAAGRVPILGGCGATTTREAAALVAAAADAGCDAAMVLTPWFEHPTEDELHRYFSRLAEASPLPILLYHFPSRTGVAWSVPAIARMAHAFPGKLIGIKDAINEPRRVRALRARVPKEFQLFSGGPDRRPAFARAGAVGSIDTLANCIPREAKEAFDGDRAKQRYCAELHQAFRGVRTSFLAPLKAVLCALGLPAGKPRAPFEEGAPEDYERIKLALRKGGRLVAGDAGRPSSGVAPATRSVRQLMTAGLEARALRAPAVPAVRRVLARPEAGGWQYNHHPAIAWHGGQGVAVFSSGRVNEDHAGQTIRFAVSADGRRWSAPRPVMAPPRDFLRWSTGGLWRRGSELWLLAGHCRRARYVDGESAPGVCWDDPGLEFFRWTGRGWKRGGTLGLDFFANEAPRALPEGTWLWPGVNARHDVVILLGRSGDACDWRARTINRRADGLRLTEPSWFLRPDGTIVVLLRDDGGSRRLWVSESADLGETWSAPRPTDIPDAQCKFFCLALPDGRVALLSNATSGPLRRRFLSIAISRDGHRFPVLRKLRCDPQAHARLPGMHKAPGFQYVHATTVGPRLYVIYSVNKEDVELSVVDWRKL